MSYAAQPVTTYSEFVPFIIAVSVIEGKVVSVIPQFVVKLSKAKIFGIRQLDFTDLQINRIC